MAQKVVVSYLDDLDGSVASETVTFGLDTKTYEVDLSDENARELRAVLSEYIEVARQVKNGKPVVKPKMDRGESQKIREWANAQGMGVSPRGRISAIVVKKYREAH